MTITKDHKQGFAITMVLLIIIYFLFLRTGKKSNYMSLYDGEESNYKLGGGCDFSKDGNSIVDCTVNCFGTWTNVDGVVKCVGKGGGGALGTKYGKATASKTTPTFKKTGLLAWLFS